MNNYSLDLFFKLVDFIKYKNDYKDFEIKYVEHVIDDYITYNDLVLVIERGINENAYFLKQECELVGSFIENQYYMKCNIHTHKLIEIMKELKLYE